MSEQSKLSCSPVGRSQGNGGAGQRNEGSKERPPIEGIVGQQGPSWEQRTHPPESVEAPRQGRWKANKLMFQDEDKKGMDERKSGKHLGPTLQWL